MESSSLTDDNHYLITGASSNGNSGNSGNGSSGNASGNGNSGNGWKPNMFKDAQLGSTFHKSRKIVRPNDDEGKRLSIPEGSLSSN